MSKSKSKRMRKTQRDAYVIARRDDLFDFADPRLLRVRPTDAQKILKDLEDRRRFAPDPFREPIARTVGDKRLVLRTPKKELRHVEHRFSFARPEFVSVCARRKERREVLFARKGSGGRMRNPLKKPIRNALSNIICKR